MKWLFRFTACWWLFGPVGSPARAALTSLYVFGDGLSTTTNGPGGPYYYGRRYSNGRDWVEVLAERQGLIYNSNRNWSYYGHFSPNLVANVNAFVAPPDAGTALVVVWVNNADFVYGMNYPYGTNITLWTNAIQQSLTNHFRAITNLYAKGVRTLVLPTAVDITQIPYYVNYAPASKPFIRQMVMDFNVGFAATVNQARASCPGLTIYVPNMFTLLDKLLTRPADYGLTNALRNGQSVDALQDPTLTDKSLNGRGTNYIFWDNLHPTAKAQAWVAEEIQQLLSPVEISSFTFRSGTNRLAMVNLPIGRPGFIESSTNCVNWATVANIPSTNATQTFSFPATGSPRFYRLRFPFTWSWP